MTSPGKIQLETIITSLYSLPQTTHLSHLIIRIERARTDCVRVGLATPSPSVDCQAQNRLKRLLEELVEVLEEKRLAQLHETNDVQGESRALHLGGVSAGEYTKTQGQVNTLLKRMRVQSYDDTASSGEERPRKAVKTVFTSTNTFVSESTSSQIESILSNSSAAFPSTSLLSSTIPSSIAKSLSEAYTLHLLATSPSKILPPGKSIASLFKSLETGEESRKGKEVDQEGLKSRVRRNVEQAYFDSFITLLSNSTTSDVDKAVGWNQLLRDIWEASSSLIPDRMAAKAPLRAEFSTTTSSFSSHFAAITLHNLVSTLAKLVAPVRDAQVSTLLESIASPLDSSIPSTDLTIPSLVRAVKDILDLASEMTSDVANFKKLVAKEALTKDSRWEELLKDIAGLRERKAMLEVYGTDEGIQLEFARWIRRNTDIDEAGWNMRSREERGEILTHAFVETIFCDQAVGLPSFDALPPSLNSSSAIEPSNILPPSFIIQSPELFKLQNAIQALIILACLLSLLPSSTPPSNPAIIATESGSFPKLDDALVDRLWTILKFEYDGSSTQEQSSADEGSHTKVVHLADELIRVSSGRTPGLGNSAFSNEIDLRAAVERILKCDDPVYRLLKGRLKDAIRSTLKDNHRAERVQTGGLPTMRTGRALVDLQAIRKIPTERKIVGKVKGFDRSLVLMQKLSEVVDALEGSLDWSNLVWADLLVAQFG